MAFAKAALSNLMKSERRSVLYLLNQQFGTLFLFCTVKYSLCEFIETLSLLLVMGHFVYFITGENCGKETAYNGEHIYDFLIVSF